MPYFIFTFEVYFEHDKMITMYYLSMQLLLKGAAERGAKRIRVHALTDGRDVLDGSSVGFMETIENDLANLRAKGIDAQVASGGGRMYVTMDRYEVERNYASGFSFLKLS